MGKRHILTAPRTCVGSRRYYKPRRTVGTDTSAARPYAFGAYARRRNDCVFNVFPMNHIVADYMSPAYLRPIRSRGVMLVKYMVFALVIKRRMRFVHPYCGRQSVILRAISVTLVNGAVKRNILPVERGMPFNCVGIRIYFFYLFG